MAAPIVVRRFLLAEALPSLASAARPFANAPLTTGMVVFTVRTAGITGVSNGDQTSPTAGDVGIDYAPDTYEWAMPRTQLLQFEAIQNGGTSTGYIEYFALERGSA